MEGQEHNLGLQIETRLQQMSGRSNNDAQNIVNTNSSLPGKGPTHPSQDSLSLENIVTTEGSVRRKGRNEEEDKKQELRRQCRRTFSWKKAAGRR